MPVFIGRLLSCDSAVFLRPLGVPELALAEGFLGHIRHGQHDNKNEDDIEAEQSALAQYMA